MGDMQNPIHTHSAEETRTLGGQLAREFQPKTLVTLEGDLGAGKTTFLQGALEALGAERPYVSPTFVIMKEYALSRPTPSGIRRIYHADAYRVAEKDFVMLGLAEWLADPEGIVFLEWPERIAGILPKKRIALTLRSLSETEREIMVTKLLA